MNIEYKKLYLDKGWGWGDIPLKGAYHVIVRDCDQQLWVIGAEFHREDGPAIQEFGNEYYMLENNEYEREDYWKELYKRGRITYSEMLLELL